MLPAITLAAVGVHRVVILPPPRRAPARCRAIHYIPVSVSVGAPRRRPPCYAIHHDVHMHVSLHDSRAELHDSSQQCCACAQEADNIRSFKDRKRNNVALPLGRDVTSQTGLQIGL